MRRTKSFSVAVLLLLCTSFVGAQDRQFYFVDGYHGGVYGHYPPLYTRFLVDQLRAHPTWKMNLEIEPETWDVIAVYETKAYNEFREMMADQSPEGRIEYVNPAYAQPYAYNIYGESLIRQFTYGIKKLKQHFPYLVYSSYAVEEPCFTTALPTVLKSLGFKYASTKCPNTCWGGYFAPYGKDLIDWVGPDGQTSILTSPRYAIEELDDKTTWSTYANSLSPRFTEAAIKDGIRRPIGMCLQDAGWKGGPWLNPNDTYKNHKYVLWREYFERYALPETAERHQFTQEDVKPGLVWGAQVLQRLSQQVRHTENNLMQAEKMASMASLISGLEYPTADLDQAWRNQLLTQHHDCWIVPYNGKAGDTWADKVADWTSIADYYCKKAMVASAKAMAPEKNVITVYNTLGIARTAKATLEIPSMEKEFTLVGPDGQEVAYRLEGNTLSFMAKVPAYGYSTYRMEEGSCMADKELSIHKSAKRYILQNEYYTITVDPAAGGTVSSIKLRKENNKEWVDGKKGYRFNELRGYWTKEDKYYTSSQHPASVTVEEESKVAIKLRIEGIIANQRFVQTIALTKGSPVIDCKLQINWDKAPQIGKNIGKKFDAGDREKAFYNDKYKLHLTFPSVADGGSLYKNAPFDVCKSMLDNTFYDSWDTIKHNLILQWLSVNDGDKNGLALLSDHTTSYLYGKDYPLGLTVQFIGRGLWGRDYVVAGPTHMHYALIPHKGTWERANIEKESAAWNEPLIAHLGAASETQKSLITLDGTGYELVTAYWENDALFVRLFNASGDAEAKTLPIGFDYELAQLVELDGREITELTKNGKITIQMPRYGVRTLKFTR